MGERRKRSLKEHLDKSPFLEGCSCLTLLCALTGGVFTADRQAWTDCSARLGEVHRHFEFFGTGNPRRCMDLTPTNLN